MHLALSETRSQINTAEYGGVHNRHFNATSPTLHTATGTHQSLVRSFC
ncbi:hypothetical protein NP493_1159g01043 [Ridgeia piscesae]|uniref:Uncharacterized protein n=1 Tax=Ridgeia piscesae TaxID=27915 RepID=A0AAD9KEN5_RIDPI|nr:hypothetical protein NP493_1159g01043 [Ridgeia piscesae]